MESVGLRVVGLRQPVVAPVHDTMATGDVLIRLAKAVGSPAAEAFPWKDYRAACAERLKGLLDSKESSTAASTMADLMKGMQRDAGWWMPRYPYERWESAFPTPSGKFEF